MNTIASQRRYGRTRSSTNAVMDRPCGDASRPVALGETVAAAVEGAWLDIRARTEARSRLELSTIGRGDGVERSGGCGLASSCGASAGCARLSEFIATCTA